ncbi:hypothetical protein [Streptomyces sp. NPDC088733]|uniref:hypothetical protein n=1 Tax=Streptomyces sp. NPDC088733 TaxID=3365880 RepID=UPI0038097378
MNHDGRVRIDGPHPIDVTAIPGGVELDVAAIVHATLAYAVDRLTDDRDLYDELQAVAETAPTPGHAPERLPLERLVAELMRGASTEVKVYGSSLRQLVAALHQAAFPKPVPGQIRRAS